MKARRALQHVIRRAISVIIILILLIISIIERGEAALILSLIVGLTIIYVITQDYRSYLESLFPLVIYMIIYALLSGVINSFQFSIAIQLSIIFSIYMAYILIKASINTKARRGK
ncbi:MAG: hypothetical protein RXR03_02105 [Thermocladium sp.]|jgi:predicted membrane protein|nr:MAG: hypothetical protein AT710_07380 [Thermocladium sp. ECH_B]